MLQTTGDPLLAVCSFFDIVNGAVTVGCNSAASLNRSSADWLKVSQHFLHVDLVHAIWRLHSHLPICILFQHVGGHQDHNASYETLLRLTQLNIDMDHKAKVKLQSLITANAPPPYRWKQV